MVRRERVTDGEVPTHRGPVRCAPVASRRPTVCCCADVQTSDRHNFSPFAPFPILIEDPEGNMMRSVDLYSFYIVYTIMTDPDRGHLFSRDPANARDVPAGPPVAPPSGTCTAGGAAQPAPMAPWTDGVLGFV